MLGDSGNAGRQTAGQADKHVLHRCGAVVLGRENLGMVGIERERGPVLLLLAEAEIALDGGVAVGAVLPLADRPPLELGALGRLGQRFARAEQCGNVDAVVDLGFRCSHFVSPRFAAELNLHDATIGKTAARQNRRRVATRHFLDRVSSSCL